MFKRIRISRTYSQVYAVDLQLVALKSPPFLASCVFDPGLRGRVRDIVIDGREDEIVQHVVFDSSGLDNPVPGLCVYSCIFSSVLV